MFANLIRYPVAPLTLENFASIPRPTNEPGFALSCLHFAFTKARELDIPLTGKAESFHMDWRKEVETSLENPNSVSFHYYHSIPADMMAEIAKHDELAGMTRLKLCEDFISNKTLHDVVFFSNPESNTALLFTKAYLSAPVYHLAISFYPKLFPTVFKDQPPIAQEIEALKSLGYKTSDKFNLYVSSLLKPLSADIIRGRLAGCLRAFRIAEIDTAKRQLEDARRLLDSYMNQYAQQMEVYNEKVISYEGLVKVREDTDEATDELINYIAANPNLHEVKFDNNCLYFMASTKLTNIDPEKWRHRARRGEIYDAYNLPPANIFSDRNNRKILLNALFGSDEPELMVNIAGDFMMNIANTKVSVSRAAAFDSVPELKDYLPNPHFSRHACLGQNSMAIMQCLRERNLIPAIECAIAATGSVNIDEEDLTFRPFVQTLLTSSQKVIWNVKEGKNMTTAEALLWLINKEKEGANETA